MCVRFACKRFTIDALLNLVMNMSAGGVAEWALARSVICSYLNQLKEKRPLQHGKISRTVPELEKDLVISMERCYCSPRIFIFWKVKRSERDTGKVRRNGESAILPPFSRLS